MKRYSFFIVLVGLLCCTACANKNVAAEEAEELTTTENQEVEGYDVTAVANSVCACLDEQAKAANVTNKKPLPTSSNSNVFKYKANCEKKAYVAHGAPTSKTIRMSIETALQNTCGHYLNSTEMDTKNPQSKTDKKGVAKGKKEPIRLKKDYKPVPELSKQ